MTHTLVIQASARRDGSVTRDLSTDLAEKLGGEITVRDLAEALPQIDESWVGANFTPAEERSEVQKAILAQSDALVAELQAADTLVIGLPVYNFGMPAALKAWIDLVARARVTFEYTPEGPRGLLTGKKAYIVVASGGTEALSAIDFATPHLRHVLGFLGIADVEIITADRQMVVGEAAVAAAKDQIDGLVKVAA
ncbi:FMN-dependent NADH-azoreductase [Pontivivens insulae]|uniref:FMN dependent NADH:quinone oxidoreductase n=1 Tax=Pontivivens insulae TaxID=1639689 RepID=A0A2R8ADX5_9RHOB|nr:NAD(P)H-dependent oxidoreductase [Pontivivens insulae]RED14203.1 FMN-dependent NADH-azoreductase [Pontivivens insulae]SPF30278.1 FMN-dependent NADH-azoreductase [Pontivivens insulae]